MSLISQSVYETEKSVLMGIAASFLDLNDVIIGPFKCSEDPLS